MLVTKVDILAIGVHPDDVEMGAGATIAQQVERGRRVGILDLTRGELATRGTPEIRRQEALEAMAILGASWRLGLDIGDGFFDLSKENRLQIVEVIRKCQPEIVITNTIRDRHPDHGRAAKLVKEAVFLSGVGGVKTYNEQGDEIPFWRPKNLYYFIQDYMIEPDLIVQVSDAHMTTRRKAVMAFKSQFYDPNNNEPESPLTTPFLIDQLDGRCLAWGRQIGSKYGEGFNVERFIGVKDLFDLI